MRSLISRFAQNLASSGIADSRIAIALSGGPDSTALAALAASWHQQLAAFDDKYRDPPLALIVDHQLRPESTEEAHQTAHHAKSLGLTPQLLRIDWSLQSTVDGENKNKNNNSNNGGIPARGKKMVASREARYTAMFQACESANISNLLTAHHADDQAETFLLRLIHASGVEGLGGIPVLSNSFFPNYHVRLIRPLLGVHKYELVEYCDVNGLWYCRDPTNDDVGYHRNMLRQRLWSSSTDSNGSASDNIIGGSSTSSVTSSSEATLSTTTTTSGEEGGEEESSLNTSNTTNTTSSIDTTSTSSTTSHVIPEILEDVLTVQRVFHRAATSQRRASNTLLRKSILHIPLRLRSQLQVEEHYRKNHNIENNNNNNNNSYVEQQQTQIDIMNSVLGSSHNNQQQQQSQPQSQQQQQSTTFYNNPLHSAWSPPINTTTNNTSSTVSYDHDNRYFDYRHQQQQQHHAQQQQLYADTTVYDRKPWWFIDWPERLVSISDTLSSFSLLLHKPQTTTTTTGSNDDDEESDSGGSSGGAVIQQSQTVLLGIPHVILKVRPFAVYSSSSPAATPAMHEMHSSSSNTSSFPYTDIPQPQATNTTNSSNTKKYKLSSSTTSGTDLGTSMAAISRILHVVSQREYPPSHSDCKKLAERLKGGTMTGAFTGGGCIVQPIVKSKGRFVIVYPQKMQEEVVGVLRECSKSGGGRDDGL